MTESLGIYRDLGDCVGIATELCRCARALASAGNAGAAVRLLASSEALHEEAGVGPRPYLVGENEATLAAVRGQLEDDAFADAWEQGRVLTAAEAVALALESLG